MGKYALIIVGALIFSLLTYSYALKNALLQSNFRLVQTYSHNQANNIAQSAAMVVINDIRNNETSYFIPSTNSTYEYPSANGFADWSILNGAYHVEVMNQADTLLHIQATGRFEDDTYYRASVGLSTGTATWNPLLNQALHANHLIHPSGNVDIGCVDGSPQCLVTINSIDSGAIDVSGNSSIDADLLIGPGGDESFVVNGAENITGQIGTMPQKIDYPLPKFPDYGSFDTLPGTNVYNTSTTLLPEHYDNKHFGEILLTQGNNTLTIDTGDQDRMLIVGKLALGGQNRINIIGEGKLSIYVEYEIGMNGGSSVNKDGDINNLMLYYKGNQDVELHDETIEFGGNTIFNGSIFAEYADISLLGTAGIQGNVMTGGNVQIGGDAGAISRVIYAPNGTVSTFGDTVISGSVISNEFTGSGNVTLTYDPNFNAELPDLEVIQNYPIVYWN